MRILQILMTLLFKMTVITHEIGHLFACKLLGIQITGFTIGDADGKHLFSIKNFHIHEYHINRGGRIHHNGEERLNKTVWQRIFVSYAGPFSDIICLSIVTILYNYMLNYNDYIIISSIIYLWMMFNYMVQSLSNVSPKKEGNILTDGYKIYHANTKIWRLTVIINYSVVAINFVYFGYFFYKILSIYL